MPHLKDLKSLSTLRPLTILLLVIALLGSSSSAFVLDFYLEDNCAGEDLGNWIGGPNQGCQTSFDGVDLGQASGVTVQSTGPIDDGTIVVFYSSPDCNPDNAVVEADNSCLSINDFADTAESWNVITLYEYKRRIRRRAVSEPAHMEARVATSSSNPYGYEHGQVSQYGGKTYKWQQVANGVWRGINPEDWDDNVNAKSDVVIEYSANYPRDFSKRDATSDISIWQPSTLEDRAFLYATCQAARKCYIAVQDGAVYSIGYTYLYFLNVAQNLANNQRAQSLWTFLNQPVVVAATVSIGAAYYSGAVSAATSGQVQAAQCSDSQTDLDAMQSLIQAVASAAPERAFQAAITYNGVVGTISMEAVPTGQRGDGNTCGAPSTDPTTNPPQRREIAWFG
jgi:hypothetical protein